MDGVMWNVIDTVSDGGIDHQNQKEYGYDVDKQVESQFYMVSIENSGDEGALYYGSQLSEILLYGDVSRISSTQGDSVTDQVKGINESVNTVHGDISSEDVENLFDGNRSTKLFSSAGIPCTIAWTMNQETTLYSYTITTANDNEIYKNRTLKAWKLYGSKDGSNWELIDTVTDSGIADANYADYTYLVDKVGTYTYFKIDIQEKYGNGFQISDITLHGVSVVQSELKALFLGDWEQVKAGYKEGLSDLFYNVYPRLYERWALGRAPKTVFVKADKGYDGVAYTLGSSVVISVDWMNGTTDYGYFSHELTHVAQQYGNVSGNWWVENMANYGGFRYYHWASDETVQIYTADDESLQDWGYEAYGNNKWFFAYMDAKYPSTKNSDGTIKRGLIDSLNYMVKTNSGTHYSDDPYDTNSDWNKMVKSITGFDCIESLRLHYVEELKNGTWDFKGFANFEDNWITENLPGLENPKYPMALGKTHGNTTAAKLSNAVTNGNNLCIGAKVVSTSGQMNDGEAASKLIDGNLETKWCSSKQTTNNQQYALTGAQHFVKIDLGSEKSFNTYTLYNTRTKEGYDNITEWEILVSKDGQNWTSVDYQVNNNNDLSSYNIGNQTARYVLMKVFDPGTLRLYEFQLYNQ